MSTKGVTLYHPVNGYEEKTWEGFSWPAFFFGVIWLAFKGMWIHFLISFLIIIFISSLLVIPIWIFYAFMGNELHKQFLLRKGYLYSLGPGNRI
jgi:hypothetical protein